MFIMLLSALSRESGIPQQGLRPISCCAWSLFLTDQEKQFDGYLTLPLFQLMMSEKAMAAMITAIAKSRIRQDIGFANRG